MIIYRNYERTHRDDYLLNVLPYVCEYDEVIDIIVNNELIGWKIISRYE